MVGDGAVHESGSAVTDRIVIVPEQVEVRLVCESVTVTVKLYEPWESPEPPENDPLLDMVTPLGKPDEEYVNVDPGRPLADMDPENDDPTVADKVGTEHETSHPLVIVFEHVAVPVPAVATTVTVAVSSSDSSGGPARNLPLPRSDSVHVVSSMLTW